MTQPTLFDNPPEIKVHRSIAKEERPRLSRQCQQILDRLRRGPAEGCELAAITHRFGGRVLELRRAGYDVRLVSRDYKTGVTLYELKEGECDG